MATSRQCFGRVPEVTVLAIRGYSWELTLGLTPHAARNLAGAVGHLTAARHDVLCEPA
jgi:hypothetical protein